MSRAPGYLALSRALALAVLLGGLFPAGAAAQRRFALAEPLKAGAHQPPGGPSLAPPLRLVIPPRSFRVAAVPLPGGLPAGGPVAYEYLPVGPFTILGSSSGSVDGSHKSAAVLLTIGVPAHARAGVTRAGYVRFHAGASVVDAPVDVEVATIRELRVTLPHQVSAVPGRSFDVNVQLVNLGNVDDTVLLHVVPPQGWRVRLLPSPAPFVLGMGEVASRVARVLVPTNANLGGFMLRVLTESAGVTRSDDYVLVQVGQETSGSGFPGPVLRTSVSTASAGTGQSAGVLGAALSGQLAPDVHVEGRLTASSGSAGLAQRGLARLGVYPSPGFLSLTAPTWRLEAGTAAAAFGELTGTNAWGRGVGAYYADSGWVANALAARTGTPLGTYRGGLFGTTLGMPLLGGSVQGTVVRLTEGDSAAARRLDAAGLGFALPRMALGTASAEMAYRRFGDVSGMGFSGRLESAAERGSYHVQLVHAPGGTSAFARATDEWSASFERALSRHWRSGLDLVQSRDSNASFRSLRSASYTMNQELLLRARSSVSVSAGLTKFSASPTSGGQAYGTEEQRASLGLMQALGAFGLSGRVDGSRVAREVSFEDGLSSTVAGNHVSAAGSVDWGGRRGMLLLEGTLDRSDQRTGYLPQQSSIRLEANQVRLPVLSRDLLLNGEILHTRWGAYRSPTTAFRAGARLPLPGDYQLGMDVERNPLFRGAAGDVPILLSMMVERSTRLPRLNWGGTGGCVFQDLDGDGQRGDDEPGLAGVVVTLDGLSTHTGADGRYRFVSRSRSRPRIDVRSLPEGFVAEEPAGPRRGNDIAVVSTARVDVTLELRPDSVGRTPHVDLLQALVYARDRAGHRWQARRPSAGVAIFDALPIGDYVIELDPSELSEPLRILGVPPTFRVRGAEIQVLLPLVGRPVRLFRANPAGTAGGRP